MMNRLASNKAINGIKGIAGKVRMPNLALPEIMVGASVLGVGAAIWAGMRGGRRITDRMEREGYLKRGVGYTGKR